MVQVAPSDHGESAGEVDQSGVGKGTPGLARRGPAGGKQHTATPVTNRSNDAMDVVLIGRPLASCPLEY